VILPTSIIEDRRRTIAGWVLARKIPVVGKLSDMLQRLIGIWGDRLASRSGKAEI
jgi:hypothetical protein